MGRRKSVGTRPAPRMSDAEHEAVTFLLMACTLGQLERPELRVDLATVLRMAFRNFGDRLAAAFRTAA